MNNSAVFFSYCTKLVHLLFYTRSYSTLFNVPADINLPNNIGNKW